MNERSILKVQVQSMLDELAWLEAALDGIKSTPPCISARASFANEIKKQTASFETLRRQVGNNLSMERCWASFRDLTHKSNHWQCVPVFLFRECLAYLEGALARNAGLDQGLCQIADAMLCDISQRIDIPWERFTILAEGEFFADLAQIIRLRFPLSIWDLPVAGHEFGHFVGQRMEIIRIGSLGQFRCPFKEILDGEGKAVDERQMRHLHEHFADIFATYALGPAFACTCILLRFDPATACDDGNEHPSPAKRVHVILRNVAEDERGQWGRGQTISRYHRHLARFVAALPESCGAHTLPEPRARR